MIPFFKSKSSAAPSAENARESLIREEVRFLLQGNDARFLKQLRARLLEEGCNLPLSVARPCFCRHVVAALSRMLNESEQSAFERRFGDDFRQLTHPEFHRIIRYLHGKLPGPETSMARAALDAVAEVMAIWRLDDAMFTDGPEIFDATAGRMIAMVVTGNPGGRLAALPHDLIRRRLRLALTAALLRHATDPEAFRSRFGPVHGVFSKMTDDPALFSRVMTFLKAQMPYFDHIASQVFWRTLNHLDADHGELSKTP